MVSVSGLSLNVTTVLGIIQKAEAAALALPEFKDLFLAAISIFSPHDQDALRKEYEARMPQTDADHLETQKELQEKAAEVPGSGEADTSPKGGAQ
jgi:hypothetical protein